MKTTDFQKRAFIVLLLSIFTLLLFILKPFLMPIIVGGVLVLLFYPLYSWVLKLCRGRAYAASFITTFAVTIFIFVPAALIASLVTNQILGLVDQSVQFVDKAHLLNNVQELNGTVQNYLTQIEQTFHVDINLRAVASNAVKQFAYYVYKYSPGVLAQTLGFFLQSFIMLIVIFFLFVEGKYLYQEFILLSPIEDKHEITLAREMKDMIYAVVYGSFITAFVQAVLAGLAFYFLNVQGFLVWGALTFLFSFIPILGAGSVWVPAAIILFLTGNTKQAIFLAFYGALIISGVDNVLKPLLMRGKNKIHPLLLFLSIIGGLALVGPIGILLGPITVAVFLAALKIYKKDYLHLSEPKKTLSN